MPDASLESVRADAEARCAYQEPLLEPYAWRVKFKSLFIYSYWKNPYTEEVPKDLLEDVVFALRMWVKILSEDIKHPIRVAGFPVLSTSSELNDGYRLHALDCARKHLVAHLMHSEINQPAEAVEHFRAIMSRYEATLEEGNSMYAITPWLGDMELYARYSGALIMAGHFNEDTKRLLDNLVEATTPPSPHAEGSHMILIEAHMDLALLLQEIGTDPDEQQAHVEWVNYFLYLNPHGKPYITSYLQDRTLYRHPVAEALGPGWFEEPALTIHEEIKEKWCANCEGSPPLKALSRCSGCSQVYYCSRVLEGQLEISQGNFQSRKSD